MRRRFLVLGLLSLLGLVGVLGAVSGSSAAPIFPGRSGSPALTTCRTWASAWTGSGGA